MSFASVSLGLAESSPNRVPKILYDRKSAASALSISLRALDYLISAKVLKTKPLGRKRMIHFAELLRFANEDHEHLTSCPSL